ncbi:YjbE family integral membrane protein [Hoeflea marina]|uniref:YjbE family integral membrane protein n=1 Tax=Hoeflea marina TaxID=274592 RepID=A0A317PHU2_9HYPH|nr:YjbE family putative metal transport protein [Hoeflea marina]PWW00002.1 YjbE family integral membrane protein [Hoeflea marina]
MLEELLNFGSIVIADIVLSGDNALIIGMVAASLAPELRRRAIIFGMVIAALMRIGFALIATNLLDIPGLLLLGSLLLFWVCWRLYGEIRSNIDAEAALALATADSATAGYTGAPRRSLGSALIAIGVADVSMSIDNVLAVAAIARGNEELLIFGLGLAILLMAFAATLIMKLLSRFPWVSWLGLAVLVYVAGEMFHRGIFDPGTGILAYAQGTGAT